MPHYQPRNLDLKRPRKKGVPCTYCQVETRVYTAEELYSESTRNRTVWKGTHLCACIECLAWAPAAERYGKLVVNGNGEVMTRGTIADKPTRRLRQRTFQLQEGLLRTMSETSVIRHPAKRYTRSERDYAMGRALQNLAEAHKAKNGEPLPIIGALQREELERYINFLRTYRVELEGESVSK